MSIYGSSKILWQKIPLDFRNLIAKSKYAWVFKEKLKQLLSRCANHDEIYDQDFYKSVEKWDHRSCMVIACSIVEDIHPSSVLDVGCGTGALLVALQARGVPHVQGIELSDEALKICRKKALNVVQVDLCKATALLRDKVDLVICLEVAEHLPEYSASHLVQLLCAASDRVAFSAAAPGQGGTSHLNEQGAAYWIAKFNEQKYSLDEVTTFRWRKKWQSEKTLASYYANIMLFTLKQ